MKTGIMETQQNKTVECLNRAFAYDPDAISALISNKVPCNDILADDKDVVVGSSGGSYRLSALGLINGILKANGLPLVMAIVDDQEHTLFGFDEYKGV